MVATSGSGWRLAPCLVELFEEADRRKPTRSRVSDGSIGDLAHSTRESDHNPADGWVTAGDLDDDGDSADLGVRLLRQHLVASTDPRVKYLIHEGTVWKAYENRGLPAWTPQPYTGVNAHAKHLHVSVWNTAEARNDLDPWWPGEDDDMPTPEEIRAIVRSELDAHETWLQMELGTNDGDPRADSLYGRIRANAKTIRDGLAALIRGGG
jgi:hypothetical protein